MTGRIQAAIKQRRGFRSIEEEVFIGLQLVADRLAEPWARVLKESADLTMVQYNVLRILRGAGADGLWAGELAERLITRSPDVTRIVDRLETRGLVRRSADPADRRAVRVHITDEGRERIAPFDAPQMRGRLVEAFAGIGARRLEALRDTLEDILTAVEPGAAGT